MQNVKAKPNANANANAYTTTVSIRKWGQFQFSKCRSHAYTNSCAAAVACFYLAHNDNVEFFINRNIKYLNRMELKF